MGDSVRRRDGVTLAGREEAVTIAIASGKGGTGKSFLATSLAVLAARPSRAVRGSTIERSTARPRVALLDCDFGLACDHLLLGVQPERTLNHVFDGSAALQDVGLSTAFGVTLIPGGSGIQRMADLGSSELSVFGSQIGEFVTNQDVVYFDVGAGISRQTILPLVAADHVILVTQPEIAALTDAYALIKCLASQCRQAPFSIVVNRVAEVGQGDKTYRKLAEVARRFTGVELHYLGEVLDDPAVTQRRLGQEPLVVSDTVCRTSTSLHRIHDRLCAVLGSLTPRRVPEDRGFAARFRAVLEQLA